MNPKILVGAPIYSQMKYCVNDFLNALRKLDWDNYDILIIDNSKTDEFFKELRKEQEIILIKDDTQEEENKLRLISSRNKILKYALENGYDYILMMDSDVIAPENIIKKLLKGDKDVISGLYYNHFVVDGKQKLNPVCWREVSEELFNEAMRKYNFPELVKSKADLRRFLTKEEADSGDILKVKLPSAGCMLIKRNVFEKIKYGMLDNLGIKSTGDDVYFCTKAREEGFELYCDTSVKCEHLFSGKLYKDSQGNLRNPLLD